MGGLMHLFDFNQALAGRKLLVDKKSAAGLEVPRNSLDVGSSIPEVPKSYSEKSEEVPYGYELQNASAPKRFNGLPIKALIAQELLKESDNKDRAPSVVARLMGLDALPTGSKGLHKPSAGGKLAKIDEKFTQRSVVDRQRPEEITPHNVSLYAKKAKDSVGSVQNSSAPQQSDSQDGKSGSKSVLLRNHPQEQQLREFKKEFEAWQSQKLLGNANRSSRLDDKQAHMSSQQGFQREKRLSSTIALPRESFSSAKLTASQDGLHESREFQDALDFLQSNKEFFMRFLHEPNSLFARHLRDNEPDSLSPPQELEGMKHQIADASEGSRPQSWAKDAPISKLYLKSDSREESRRPSWAKESPMLRSPRDDVMAERSIFSTPHSPLIGSEELSGLQGRYRHAFLPMAPENRLYNANCHIPTRIVVLKPSPGKVRNLKSVSSVSCRSPKDQHANHGCREDSTDVLERLREKLRKDSCGAYKRERRSVGVNINEQQYRDASKDPREIAREIARQVRENITRDLMVDPRCLSNLPSTVHDSNSGRRPMRAVDSQKDSASGGAACGLASRSYLHNYPRSTSVSLYPDISSELEALVENREKVSVLEQVRTKSTTVSDRSQEVDFGSNNGVFHKYNIGQIASSQVVSRIPEGSGRSHLDSLYRNELYHGSICHELTGQVEEPRESDPVCDLEPLAHDCAEENECETSTTLLRSQSANSATPGDENMTELQMYRVGDYSEDLATEASSVRIAHNMVVDLARPSDVNAHSTELATNLSSSTKSMDDSGDSGMGEVKRTVVRLEERIGPRNREEVGAVNKNILLQRCGECSVLDGEFSASLHETCLVDSMSIDSVSSQKHGTLVHRKELSVELFEVSAGQDGESSCSAQTREAVYPNDDTHALLDTPIASPAFMSVPVSDLSADCIPEPAKELPEQPSPISVLDLPFQEELLVATELERSSEQEEIQMGHCLVKSGNGDNDQQNVDIFGSELDASVRLEQSSVAEGGHADHMEVNEGDTLKNFHNVEEMVNDSEMLYVKNILDSSGFTRDCPTAWCAPGQPLNPCLFQKMESSSFDQEKDTGDFNQPASKLNKQGKEKLNIIRRRLLFDIANEMLLNILGPHFDRCLWLSPRRLSLRMPTGHDLVKSVWSCVWCSLCSHSGSQEMLENLVAKDLGKGGSWLDVGVEVEATGLDVERAILDDLIEEALLVL